MRSRIYRTATCCALSAALLVAGTFGATAASASSAIGVNHSGATAADMDRIVALTGYPGWIRLGPEYQTNGDYHLYTEALQNAHARGLKVLLTGLGNFNTGQTTTRHSMPLVGNSSQQSAYTSYMAALLSIGADAVSPWNEPNNPNFGGPNPTWQQDSNLQADLVWAIALTGWHGTVFSSGLSPHGDTHDTTDGLVPLNWWMHLLQGDTSWASRFTVLDAHAYAWTSNGTLKTWEERYNIALQQAEIQDIIAYVGGGWKPLAWSEYGAPSSSDVSPDTQPTPIYATPQTQYNYYVDANSFWKAWETAGRPLWGKLAHKDIDDDYDKDRHGALRNFGLVDGNGNIRPAAGAFQSEAARVR
jgi:hypothetical protein